MKNEELACQLAEIVFKSIDTECQGLCKKENASILRRISTANLVDLKLENLKGELCLKAPMLTKVLLIICKSKRSKSKSQGRVDEVVVPTVASIILHSQSPEMSALVYRLDLILRHAGAGTLVGINFFGKFCAKRTVFQCNKYYHIPCKQYCGLHLQSL